MLNVSSTINRAKAMLRSQRGFDGVNFDPGALVKLTNYLHSLGREPALDILKEYCIFARRGRNRHPENVLLVARILFVRRNGNQVLPRLQLGVADVKEPSDMSILPLFPLYLKRDIPFLLIGGYQIGGQSEPPDRYLAWCARECEVRPSTLTPDNDPLESVDSFLGSEVWMNLAPKPWHGSMLRLQALRAVSNVYPISSKDPLELLSKLGDEDFWRKHRQLFATLNVMWNRHTDDYEAGVRK